MPEYSLSKQERITSKNHFSLVYSQGKRLIADSKQFKAIVYRGTQEESGVKVAFAVFKKLGSAVWRNRIKRLLRESYRLEKHNLLSSCSQNEMVLIVFSPHRFNQTSLPHPKLKDVYDSVTNLLAKAARVN